MLDRRTNHRPHRLLEVGPAVDRPERIMGLHRPSPQAVGPAASAPPVPAFGNEAGGAFEAGAVWLCDGFSHLIRSILAVVSLPSTAS